MNSRFDQYIEDKTSRNLNRENRRLKLEIEKLKEEFMNASKILDFHDQLEKDFFSADAIDGLIVKLVNRLQLRPEIDFVSLCLTKQYLDRMLVRHEHDVIFPEMGHPAKLRYLSIIDEENLLKHLGKTPHIKFEKTPTGSMELFFPDHGEEVRSHAIIPLLLVDQIIGSLNLGSILGRHYYSTDMGPDLLTRLSSKLAIAIDRIISHKKLSVQNEMLDKDIHRAALLQKSLLSSSFFEEGP
ncbi:MAG: hypothetical protein JRJ85_00530, partial [Deltaproteobacteria bacterium]|nr:hypothetical protein [Deltaproteobacteria bacterium]